MEFRESPTEKRAKEKTTAVVEAGPVETESIEDEVATPPTKPKVSTKAKAPAKAKTTRSAERIVYYLTGLVELLLAVRLILAISDPSGSTGFIYNVADPLTRPFYDLFYTTGGHEPGAGIILLAMLVYGLIGWGIGRLLRPSSRG